MLSKRFLAQSLFEDAWLTHVEERILDRPDGGSGDSCVVSRVTIHTYDQRQVTFIVKRVAGPSERYYPYDSLKTEFKRLSYKVEGETLMALSRLNPSQVLIAKAGFWLDESPHTSVLVLDDLAPHFPLHSPELRHPQLFFAVDWLSRFHHSYGELILPLRQRARVWCRGGYWCLDKRSEETRKLPRRWDQARREHSHSEAMTTVPSNLGIRLLRSARALDRLLHPGAPELGLSPGEESKCYAIDEHETEEQDAVRNRYRARLAGEVPQRMLTGIHACPKVDRECAFLRPTLIHGDFKGENIFFAREGPASAVCDFQWTGFGLGVLDLASLVFSSLAPGEATAATLDKILDRYASEMCTKRDRAILKWAFQWAIVDYARFVVSTGRVFLEDMDLLSHASQILRSIDQGNGHFGEQAYATELERQLAVIQE